MPCLRLAGWTIIMPIQASSFPKQTLVQVPAIFPFRSAAKQPSGARANKRRQSEMVWFHPSSALNWSTSRKSADVRQRIVTSMQEP